MRVRVCGHEGSYWVEVKEGVFSRWKEETDACYDEIAVTNQRRA